MMNMTDKLDKLINELEPGEDKATLEEFKKNFEVFEMTGKVCKEFLENRRGESDETKE